MKEIREFILNNPEETVRQAMKQRNLAGRNPLQVQRRTAFARFFFTIYNEHGYEKAKEFCECPHKKDREIFLKKLNSEKYSLTINAKLPEHQRLINALKSGKTNKAKQIRIDSFLYTLFDKDTTNQNQTIFLEHALQHHETIIGLYISFPAEVVHGLSLIIQESENENSKTLATSALDTINQAYPDRSIDHMFAVNYKSLYDGASKTKQNKMLKDLSFNGIELGQLSRTSDLIAGHPLAIALKKSHHESANCLKEIMQQATKTGSGYQRPMKKILNKIALYHIDLCVDELPTHQKNLFKQILEDSEQIKQLKETMVKHDLKSLLELDKQLYSRNIFQALFLLDQNTALETFDQLNTKNSPEYTRAFIKSIKEAKKSDDDAAAAEAAAAEAAEALIGMCAPYQPPTEKYKGLS